MNVGIETMLFRRHPGVIGRIRHQIQMDHCLDLALNSSFISPLAPTTVARTTRLRARIDIALAVAPRHEFLFSFFDNAWN
jgi:hypothetical protein